MTPRSLLLSALLLAAPAAASGQAQEPATVGPPELRNFELPGTRTTQPVTAEPPRPAPAPPRATPTPAPNATPTPAPQRTAPPAAPRSAPPERRETAVTQARPAPAPARETPAAERPQPEATATPDISAAPLPDIAPPAQAPLPAPLPEAVPDAVAEESGGWGGWAVAALALLALAGGALFVRRRRAEAEAAAAAERRAMARQAPSAPQPVPAPPPAPSQPEARIELEFKPERVMISESKAEVNFKLRIRNAGPVAAEDVRIAVNTFNASDRAEIDAFLADKEVPAGPMPWRMPSGYEENLEGIGKLEGAQIRAVEVQGRRLLVPVVAFNVIWRLGDGRTGQTALSFVVGRESDPPAEKMGAFRLDLGPRLYRTVGQRPNGGAVPKAPKKVRVRIEA